MTSEKKNYNCIFNISFIYILRCLRTIILTYIKYIQIIYISLLVRSKLYFQKKLYNRLFFLKLFLYFFYLLIVFWWKKINSQKWHPAAKKRKYINFKARAGFLKSSLIWLQIFSNFIDLKENLDSFLLSEWGENYYWSHFYWNIPLLFWFEHLWTRIQAKIKNTFLNIFFYLWFQQKFWKKINFLLFSHTFILH